MEQSNPVARMHWRVHECVEHRQVAVLKTSDSADPTRGC